MVQDVLTKLDYFMYFGTDNGAPYTADRGLVYY
jgi:hypothetical protein